MIGKYMGNILATVSFIRQVIAIRVTVADGGRS